MKTTISVDHLVNDGAEVAQFMQSLPQEHQDGVAEFLENPAGMLV